MPKEDVELGQLPNVGANFSLNGNKFQVGYIKQSKEGFRFSADLISKYEPEK